MGDDADAPYRVEPAKTGRSTCKISKEKIDKGELRFGSFVEMGGHGSYAWRKLECITAKVVKNVEAKVGGAEKVAGFDALGKKDQAKLIKAFKVALGKGASKDKEKEKVLKAKEKAKTAKLKAKEAKAKAKEKALASKEKKKAAKEKKLAAKAKAKAKALAKKAGVSAGEGTASSEEPATKRAKVDMPKPKEDLAHEVIDLAKAGKWPKVFEFLDLHPDDDRTPSVQRLVNLRPEVREYGILHQAAFFGNKEAVERLIEDYKAEPSVLTKSHVNAAGVATEEGHHDLAEYIDGRIVKHR